MKNTEAIIRFPQWCNQHMPHGFGQPNCVCRQVNIPKYVCLVTQLGEQLLEKQILKFAVDIL